MDRYRNSQSLSDRCVLGAAGLGGVWGKVEKEESVKVILQALESGITAIDAAPAYGDAELFVGEALKQWKGAKPKISTKVGRLKSYATDDCIYDYSPEGMEKSVNESLETLGVSSVDLLFIHEPSSVPELELNRVLETMLKFKQKGYAKQIGVGGNSPDWFKEYIQPVFFDVVMEFNRLNLCSLDALETSLPYCESKGIEFYVASPLHMGLLGSMFDSFTESPPTWLDKKYIKQAMLAKQIADKYQLSLSSLAHRFLLTIPYQFKIVIGAVDTHQLNQTIADFHEGILTTDIYKDIINSINQ